MKAASYLRSSKDRHDASIQSQRREIEKLAKEKNLKLIQEYSDTVESAKDENRPGFQSLLADLKSSDRAWDYLLMVDTSRLSRRRFIAQVFKHEAAKRGVTILYSKLPEMDPTVGIFVESIFEAIDELHSMMSKEKGLAGMRENVLNGYRAGGRAPKGYDLHYIETGAVREGKPVTKSYLKKNKDSRRIARYLKAMARGVPRARANSGMKLTASTLNGMEWNALTYAGHTVWNVHNEFNGGYKGGKKRKPREEWMVQRNTHEAIITDEEAEKILNRLENRKKNSRQTGAKYLLSGLLKNPEGVPFHGDGGNYYRADGQRVNAKEIERSVIERIVADWSSDEYVAQIKRGHDKRERKTDPAQPLKAELGTINLQISKTMDLASQLKSPRPALDKINELEEKKQILESEIDSIEREERAIEAMRNISEEQIKATLVGYAEDMTMMKREKLKVFLTQHVEMIEFDTKTHSCHIYYMFRSGVKMASPGVNEEIPTIKTAVKFMI